MVNSLGNYIIKVPNFIGLTDEKQPRISNSRGRRNLPPFFALGEKM
ncbi:hypothetical protein KNP414_07128 [Paenibacillus mucilaginosus KNP414]|uniref:Uncharacterized protein n=1 Tax=Paenibacillus mucilaginosus (strain KNP414) TaxID=1036673 RepID=F8FM12_PAEMK|nr:hypothetical protein KNP414_07128 [Paenibacillus mucilaginosus KNP414]